MRRDGMTVRSVSGRWVRRGCAVMALHAAPAWTQYEARCPPPKKLAAGACVTACPAGYEDRGRDCVYRNQSR